MEKPQKSAKGLASIGLLMAGAVLRNSPAVKPDERDVKQKIIDKTVAALPLGAAGFNPRKVVEAAVREAFNAGHANALDQNSMVEELLKKQYKARTELTLPVAVMAIMEQVGMADITLDLAALGTVNDRCRVEMSEVFVDGEPSIRFALRVRSDDHGQVQ